MSDWAKQVLALLAALEGIVFPISIVAFPLTLVCLIWPSSRDKTTESCPRAIRTRYTDGITLIGARRNVSVEAYLACTKIAW